MASRMRLIASCLTRIKAAEAAAAKNRCHQTRGVAMANERVPGQPGMTYEDGPVRAFALAAVLWGVVGMAVGVFIAAQLAWPELNFGIPWLSYGRLRPLHTNAVIFAFGGCALFATSLHVAQRTCQVPLFLPRLAKFVFWG